MHENQAQSSFLYFLLGGVAGATAALLLAPDSGSATRSRLAQKVRDGADGARDLRERVLRQGGRVVDAASEGTQEAVRIAGDASSAIGEVARRKIREVGAAQS
jgi:gas vesicle protein